MWIYIFGNIFNFLFIRLFVRGESVELIMIVIFFFEIWLKKSNNIVLLLIVKLIFMFFNKYFKNFKGLFYCLILWVFWFYFIEVKSLFFVFFCILWMVLYCYVRYSVGKVEYYKKIYIDIEMFYNMCKILYCLVIFWC